MRMFDALSAEEAPTFQGTGTMSQSEVRSWVEDNHVRGGGRRPKNRTEVAWDTINCGLDKGGIKQEMREKMRQSEHELIDSQVVRSYNFGSDQDEWTGVSLDCCTARHGIEVHQTRWP